ncbi:MAG: dCTP deaminase domain-containing protein [Nitrososphaerales archaeon]
MTILGKNILVKLVEDQKCIHPFDYELFDGDGYVLTVQQETVLNYLEHRNVVSHEVVFTPPDVVGHLTAKSKYGRLGLSFLNSVKVHSGFVGRLALELVNLNNERAPITIKRGDPLIHIEFSKREGEPSVYSGQYMFQYLNDEEAKMYANLLSNLYPSLFSIDELSAKSKARVRL